MSGDEMGAKETRIVGGVEHLARCARDWFAAGEYLGRERVKAIVGRAVGATCCCWFGGGLAYVIGPWAWAVAGGVLAISIWVAGGEHADSAEGMDPALFLELVHDLSQGANIHLVTIREQLIEETGRGWTAQSVTALCRAAGIPTRDGVRVPGATPAVTTGIHRDDLPPLPRPLPEGAVSDEEADEGTNNNTNTPTRVEVGGGAAWVNYDGPSVRQEARR